MLHSIVLVCSRIFLYFPWQAVFEFTTLGCAHFLIYFLTGDYFISFFFKINLFIYFWLRCVFVAVRGLSLVVASGGYSLLWYAEGFSLVVARRLQ